MYQQDIDRATDSDTDALAAFERMRGQLAMLTAAVEGFAARQARLEQRDYSHDLAELSDRQEKLTAALKVLADRPGVKLTPDGFAEGVERAAVKLRAPDHAVLATARTSLNDASAAMAGVVAAGRTRQKQREALLWAAAIASGLTALLFALMPFLFNAIWPAAAEDRAAAILHKSRWEAGIELMASGDPARWRQLVDADRFQHDTAQVIAACRSRADAAARPVRCSIEIAPTKKVQLLPSR